MALRSDSAINLLSICTGGGGLDLGIELAMPAARAVCMVEREAFACAHLVSAMQAGLLASCPVWSDVRTFKGQPWRGLVDGLIGGIPCQPHSLAGQRGGAQDARDLWSDTRRIIVQSRPWFVLIENVPGMLSAPSGQIAGAARVRRDLQRLGFAVEGGLFSAAEIGASHGRERLFILGVAERELADTSGARPQRVQRGGSSGEWNRTPAHGSTAELCGASVDNTISGGRAAGRNDYPSDERHQFGAAGQQPVGDADKLGEQQSHDENGAEPRQDSRAGVGGAGGELANANLAELRQEPSTGEFAQLQQDAGIDPRAMGAQRGTLPAGWGVANASGFEPTAQRRNTLEGWEGAQGEGGAERGAALFGRFDQPIGLFPPPPGAVAAWREILTRAPELEPAFCRMADGVATALDFARTDRLRMLGNGVVPLQAAYAFSTLVARLAAAGIPRAIELSAMTEAAQ